MTRQYKVGDRISFRNPSSTSYLCTVRYVGEVDGFNGLWLGVEWDDASRGKHDGSFGGTKYFTCLNPSATAGSFVRPSRQADPELSFIEALVQKYAHGMTSRSLNLPSNRDIVISGKIAQEVGFDKIRETQAQLHELKIVILDEMRISMAERENERIQDTCPKIVELDLSRNLFRQFEDVCHICSKLPNIQKLRLNGNRFSDSLSLESRAVSIKSKLWSSRITKLELDEVLMPWKSIVILTSYFTQLTVLTASSNYFRSLTMPLIKDTIVSLALEYNELKSLCDLYQLSESKSLKTLLLKGNKITTVNNPSSKMISDLKFSINLDYVDLSDNCIDSWSFVDELSTVFPGLTGLRMSNNPLYPKVSLRSSVSENDDKFMITVGRVGTLKILNFSKITESERRNAEIYYLSKIAKELGDVPEDQTDVIISKHKRFQELSEKWGPPTVNRKKTEDDDSSRIEGRLIAFTFNYFNPYEELSDITTIYREIPKSIDVYRVKGLIGKLLRISALNLRLIWETDEWDPVAEFEDDIIGSSDDDNLVQKVDQFNSHLENTKDNDKGRWKKREIEIEDGTRQIGNCIEGAEAIVRVELVEPRATANYP